MTVTEKVNHIVEGADEMKAERIETLDVREKTPIADFFVICSGNSDRHVASIADKIAEKMTTLRSKPIRQDSDSHGWILQDYGDVMVHVMREEQRQFFDLETLWRTMRPNKDLP